MCQTGDSSRSGDTMRNMANRSSKDTWRRKWTVCQRAAKCFIQNSIRKRKESGNRGNTLFTRAWTSIAAMSFLPSDTSDTKAGASMVLGQTHKSVTDGMCWVGAEGSQGLSLSRWWFNVGRQIQNWKKTRAGFNDSEPGLWKPDWVQVLALATQS